MPEPAAPLSVAVARLSTVLLDDATVDSVMQLVIAIAVASIEPCDAASISVLHGEGPHFDTLNSTSPEVVELDRVQYDTGQGPCVTATHEGRPILAEFMSSDHAWPDFSAAARDHGVTSIFSSPLSVRGKSTGALNLYSHRTDGPSDWGAEPIEAFGATASVLLANTSSFVTAAERNTQLEVALATRELIGQAKGILVERHGIDGDAAFDRLRVLSQHTNRKLRDIAQDVVDGEEPAA
jgi:transcriptional regulator with GAF, ATPase, and Fis domain